MPTEILSEPLRLGALALPNRVVMPALTRMRAGAGGVPTPLNALYYAQRASAGLNITDATAVSVQGHGYPQMPGVHTAEQVAGWRLVTDAVHAKGGLIVLQIVHHGRWSHSSYNPDGSLPVTPSAIAPPGHAYAPSFEQRPYLWALAIIEARARKQSRFLLGFADNGASVVLTLSATVLAIIGPCLPTDDRAHIPRQWPN